MKAKMKKNPKLEERRKRISQKVKDEVDLLCNSNMKTKEIKELPNEIDLNLLSELLMYSDRYDISIQFWESGIAVFIRKDYVELIDYGGDFQFAVQSSIDYLNRINSITK